MSHIKASFALIASIQGLRQPPDASYVESSMSSVSCPRCLRSVPSYAGFADDSLFDASAPSRAARRVLSSRRFLNGENPTLHKVGMNVKKRLLDGPRMNRAIRRMAIEILEKNRGTDD